MRASWFALSTVLTAVLLSGCGKAEKEAPPPPAAAVDVRRPLNALGTEPFWSLKIRPEGLAYSDVETPELIAPDPVFEPTGDGAAWTAGVSDGRRLTVSLEAKVCNNGMSDISYPFTAKVRLGTAEMSGCAAYADEMPKPGG